MGGKEDVGAAGPPILLRARDVTEKNIGAIAYFAKELGARSEAAPAKRDRRQRQDQTPVPTTAAHPFPVGRESLAGGWAGTTVVSSGTAPRIGIEEATSGELLREEQFRKEMGRKEPNHARRVGQMRESTQLQLEQEKKSGSELTRSSRSGVAKVQATGRCALMALLIRR